MTHTASGGGYDAATAAVAVTVTDDDRGIVLTPAAVTVDEGDATGAQYTVKLAVAPTEDVTVTVSGHAGSDLTLSGLSDTNTLTFTTTDWDNAQTVGVTAAEDDDPADDTVTLTHTAAGGEYDAVTAAVAVTVNDDETAALVVSETAVTVAEGDATGADYTVKLSHQPTEDVTVTVAGHAGSDLTLAGPSATATLTFTATDWDDAQTVTVTAGHDDDGTDDTATLTHTATGGGYDAATAAVAVTVTDDDRGIVLTPAAVTVDEGDATGAQYTVKLAVAPTEDVTVTVSGHAGSDLTLSGLSDTNTLTFTTTDWDNAQTVGVTAAEDDDPADDTVTLTHTAAGGEYDAVTAAVAVTVNDDETAALVVSETAVTVAEGDATGADYTVKLSHQPTEDVTVTVAGHAGSDLTLAGPSATATLTFTATDWDDAQTVTVTAGHDDDGTDDTATLTHTATGGGYDAATAAVAVTVADDDRGIVLTPAAVTVDEGDATGAQYTVKLAVAPTEDVTVTVSGHAGSDLTLSGLSDTNTLTFTTTDWDNAQTVGVTAAEDDDPADDTVTLTHTAAGGEYDAVTAAVAVTVNDDETAALVVSETAVTVAEGDATGADYTVKLSHQPTEDVTVTVAGHAGSDLTLAGPSATATLTFTATDWDDAQTVTVTAGHDDDGTDDTATLTHTASGGGYDAATAAVAVTVADDDRGIVLTPAAVTVDEGDATGAQYTVKLAVAPTEDVTVTVSGHAGSDLTLSGLSDTNTLTFTTTDWDNAQTVGVTAAEDDDPADDTVTLTHTAAGGEYDAVTAAVAVTVNDDETAALVVSETAVTVAEGDATGADYTVKLSHQPTEDVTVTVAGHAGSDLTLAGPSATATLTFTATDWDDAQTVTVTAGHDDDGTDDTATLTHTASGGGYDAATAAVAVTVADDDRGIVLTPAAVTVDEGDATGAQYTVKLAVAPTEDVTVTVSGHAGSDLTLSGLSDTNTLTFTTTDWDNAQTVGVTAAEDDDPADDTVTLTHTAAGGEYDAVTAAVAVTVNDDETAALVVSETAVTVAEGDATGADYTVKLSHQPTEDVTVTVAGHAGSDLTLAGPSATATLTFTATDWDDAQTVTVTAGHDDDGTDDTATLTHTASGGGYDAATAAVAVTVADDDRGIVLTPAAVTVDEGDATGAQYTVKLAVAPTEDVTVTVSGHAGSDLTLSGLSDTNTLTFTTTDWDNAQTVGVTAAEDDDPADDTVTLTHTAAGGEYDAVTAAVAVTVNDDETAALVVSETAVTVAEGDATGADYTVKLSHQPTEDVTVTVAGHAGSDLTLAGPSATATLTFTATDWDDAQTVTVTAGHDDDGTDDTATLTHTASGGGYDAATAAVAVTVADDDRGIVLTPAAVTVDEGDATGAQYTVKLAVAPTEDVTVTVSGHAGSDLTLSGLSDTNTLTFTTTDWDNAQTVGVTAAEDDDPADDTVTLTHTAAGGEYDAVTAAVAVTVNDDETAALVVSETAVTVAEGDATGADYTVKLSHQPTEDVTVTVAGHAGSDLTLAGPSATATLTFTATDWDDAQTVTVTAGHDDDGTDDTATLTHTATGGGYDAATAAVAVTVADDDRGIVLTPAAVTVDEGDATGAQYTVKLAVAPTEDVTVTVSGHAGSDLTLSGLSDTNTLTFTTTDWDNAQTVGVTAAEDDDPADDTVTLTHTAAGGEYDAVTAAVAVTVNDDETAALVVSETAVTVAEGDATGADYTVKLSHQPTEDVTVTVAGHAGSDLTLAGPSTTATLTFTATDWDDAQTVTVTAGHDDDGTDDTATLTHTATGGGYDAATAAVAVTVADDDRGIVLTPAAVTVDEGDATGAQYTVKLAVAPTEDVTVTVSGHAGSDLTLSGLSDTNTLTFTTTDWDNAQTVGVTAAEDDDPADDTVTLTHTAAGGEYDAVTAAVAVTVNDDETAALVVSETAVTVAEGDATGADYTVKLSHQPTEDVTVTVAGHAGSDLTLAGPSATATLTFTATDWDDAQTVTVTAGHDDDGTDDTATLTHTATGGGYDAATAAVAVTVADDDRGIVLTPAAVTVDEGDATGAQYTVKLAVAPTEDVTVTVSGHAGSDLTLSGLSDTNTLTFTTTDWDNAQTVGVTAAEDDDPADDTVTLTHTAAGGEYDAVTAAVAVTVNDDETAALVVSETAVTVAEGDATGADYTVKLSHQPTEDVTVTVAGHAGSDLTLAGPSATATLTFTATDWDDAQTVTVTAGHDDDGTDDTATLTHTRHRRRLRRRHRRRRGHRRRRRPRHRVDPRRGHRRRGRRHRRPVHRQTGRRPHRGCHRHRVGPRRQRPDPVGAVGHQHLDVHHHRLGQRPDRGRHRRRGRRPRRRHRDLDPHRRRRRVRRRHRRRRGHRQRRRDRRAGGL